MSTAPWATAILYGGGCPVSGDTDKLAQIEAVARQRQTDVLAVGADQKIADWAAVAVSTGAVLALVEIARAAREMLDELPAPERAGEIRDVRLRAAVARSRDALSALDGEDELAL